MAVFGRRGWVDRELEREAAVFCPAAVFCAVVDRTTAVVAAHEG